MRAVYGNNFKGGLGIQHRIRRCCVFFSQYVESFGEHSFIPIRRVMQSEKMQYGQHLCCFRPPENISQTARGGQDFQLEINHCQKFSSRVDVCQETWASVYRQLFDLCFIKLNSLLIGLGWKDSCDTPSPFLASTCSADDMHHLIDLLGAINSVSAN